MHNKYQDVESEHGRAQNCCVALNSTMSMFMELDSEYRAKLARISFDSHVDNEQFKVHRDCCSIRITVIGFETKRSGETHDQRVQCAKGGNCNYSVPEQFLEIVERLFDAGYLSEWMRVELACVVIREMGGKIDTPSTRRLFTILQTAFDASGFVPAVVHECRVSDTRRHVSVFIRDKKEKVNAFFSSRGNNHAHLTRIVSINADSAANTFENFVIVSMCELVTSLAKT